MKNIIINNYKENYFKTFQKIKEDNILKLVSLIKKSLDKRIYICGNGGSAANSNHIANDFTYMVNNNKKKKIKIESLSANISIITCLANDI